MDLNLTLIKNSFMLFGKIEVYYYAICIVLAFSIAAMVAIPMFKRRRVNPDLILDLMIAIVPCAIIGARAWYVILDLDEFDSFLDVLNIRQGGLAIHGGVIGGAIGFFIVSKIRHISFGKIADIGACVLPLGQAIGRWGNFFNQEVYGQITDVTWAPYSVFIEKTGHYHQALCFYEMFLDLLLFILLYTFLFHYKGKRNFYSMGAYFFFYGIIRAVLEPLRAEEFQMGYSKIPASVLTSIALIVGGLTVIVIVLVKDIKENNFWWKDFFKKKEQPPMEDNNNV